MAKRAKPVPTIRSTPESPEAQLVAKLQRIEALHARAGSEGERVAAERARERIRARLAQLEAEEPPVEFRFTLADQWSRHLFVALMRRYGIQPYRYSRQRRTTVMARLNSSFVNETLWPEFLELQETLAGYFDALTDRVIEQALDVKAGEAEERGDEANAPTPAPDWSLLCTRTHCCEATTGEDATTKWPLGSGNGHFRDAIPRAVPGADPAG